MDVSQYLEIFLDETNEHLQNLNTQILELESDPENMDNINALLLHWSAKEALFKLMGVEEVDFIRHLRIFPFSLSEEGEFEACEYRTGRQGRYRVRYVTHPDFVLTWIIK